MADEDNIYGIKYEVDIDQLKTSMKQASQQIKLADAQFKESASRLDNWGATTEGVGAKLNQLNAILDAEKTKLNNLKNDYNKNVESIEKYDQQIKELKEKKEEAISQYGEESTEVQQLSDKINRLKRNQEVSVNAVDRLKVSILKQQTSINKTEKSIDVYNARLNEIQSESSQTVSSLDKLKGTISNQEKEIKDLKGEYSNLLLEQGKTSNEAQQLASKIRELNSNLQTNKNKLSEAEKEADNLTGSFEDVGEATDETGGGFTIMKGALADLTANAISTAISKIGEFVGSLFELSEATAEYRQMNAKLEGSAKTFGYSADYAKKKYSELYGYLKDDQASTNAITNLMGLGASTKTVNQIVSASIGVWSAYGDSIPIEGLTESINETAQVGQVTGNLADALNWAGISEDDFNKKLAKTTSVSKRADLIAQTLNNTYGESKKKYDQLNGSMTEANKSELALKDSQAKLGKSMEPVNTAINNLKAKALDMIAPAVESFAQGLLDINKYLEENPEIASLVEAGIIALAVAFGILAGALAIQGIITGVAKAMAFLNTTMMANPYVLIASAIAGLVAGFIYLWNTSEGFRDFWIGLWNGIVNTVGGVIDDIVSFFTETIPGAFEKGITFLNELPMKVWNSLCNVIITTSKWAVNLGKEAGKSGKNFVKNVINFIKNLPSKAWQYLLDTVSKVTSFGIDLGKKGGEAGKKLLNTIIAEAKKIPERIKDVGNWIVKGLWNGINDMSAWIGKKIKGFGNGVLKGIKDFFGIHSPSKVFYWIGQMLTKGLGNAIEDGTEAVIKKSNNMAYGIISNMQDRLKGKIQIGYEFENLKERTAGAIQTLATPLFNGNIAYVSAGGSDVNNITFNQYNTSPKPLDSLQVYKNTQKQIKQFERWKGK